MSASGFKNDHADIAWCPGCGNFAIRDILAEALAELAVDPRRLVLVSGIGQAAKAPQYLNAHYFNGLHGRALPPATAIKAVHPSLTVIVESGDGDMYGEGGNHFLHAIRRNPDLTVIVHDNMVYGLTKGQASPTSMKAFVTPLQVAGVTSEPFNPIAVAVALDASFVARANSGDRDGTREIFKKAILHKGFALVDVLQPCVSFNKVNTFKWFQEHTYILGEGHDPGDRAAAFARALEIETMPLGVIYRNEGKPVFEEQTGVYLRDSRPLFERGLDRAALEALMDASV